jgi:hypothetical protein
MTLLTIFGIGLIVWALIKLIEKIYNIIILIKFPKNPDVTKQKQGIVYNKKSKLLEGDNSTITPF